MEGGEVTKEADGVNKEAGATKAGAKVCLSCVRQVRVVRSYTPLHPLANYPPTHTPIPPFCSASPLLFCARPFCHFTRRRYHYDFIWKSGLRPRVGFNRAAACSPFLHPTSSIA